MPDQLGGITLQDVPDPAGDCAISFAFFAPDSDLAEERSAPWKSPFYKGHIDGYSPNQCPRSLDYLGRPIMLPIDQFFTLEDADLVVEGIRKVAASPL